MEHTPLLEPPIFHTERLVLRAVTEGDIPAIQRHFADYEVIRYLARQVPWPYPANGAEEFVRKSVLPVSTAGKT